jgi:hypothetical protein
MTNMSSWMHRISHLQGLVALLLVWVLLLCEGTAIGDYPNSLCTLDDDQTNEELEKCFRQGEDFLRGYLDDIRNSEKTNYCRTSREFRSCLGDLQAKCPSIRVDWHLHWFDIYDTMECACAEEPQDVTDLRCSDKKLECFEEQHNSILSRRCDAFYKFNKKQKTRHLCHFLHENIRCKESLITSACGNRTGSFAFHVSRVLENNAIAKHRCQIRRTGPYKGFRYTDQCPKNFIHAINECSTKHITSKVLFHEHNDLVVDVRKSELRTACSEFDAYEECLAPIQDNCPEGLQLIKDYDGKSRTYMLKLQYICQEQKKVYLSQLKCYKSVVKSKNLTECDTVWDTLQPMLNEVSAHQFYCKRSNEQTQVLHRTLHELRSCYESVFTKGCGTEGGHVMGGLMTKAFQDPRYLWYKYKPDCQLHAEAEEVFTEGATMQEQARDDSTVRTPVETGTHVDHKSRTHKPKRHKYKDKGNQAQPKSEQSTNNSAIPLQTHSLHLLLGLLSTLLHLNLYS